MRILYDGQIFRIQAAGGINRYFANLISRLPEDFVPTVYGVQPGGVHFPQHRNLRTNRLLPRLPARWAPWYARNLADVAGLPGWDVAHPTYYVLSDGFRFEDYKCPVVVTIYDMIHALRPECFSDGAEIVARQKEAAESARAVICISHNTRRDLLNFYPHLADRTFVVHPGVEMDVSPGAEEVKVPDNPYFLFVGSRSSYKNFEGVLAAFANVAASHSTVRLGVAGPRFTQAEQAKMAELGLAGRLVHFEHPDDRTLAALYRQSVALLYPSQYEGFGIPPVEAMMCGTVCVASNTSSLPEVVGDAGILLDPLATKDWSEVMLDLLANPTSREPFLAKGRLRAAHFRWETAAARTVEVYQSVTDGPPMPKYEDPPGIGRRSECPP